MITKVPSGIEGLDDLLEGGFIRNRAILIQGKAGTGKTTLGIQFLVNGYINSNEKGLFISMEYNVEDLVLDMKAYNFPLQELIDKNNITIIVPPGGLENTGEYNIDDLLNYIHEYAVKNNCQRLVLDSLNTLEMILNKTQNKRKELLRFITLLRDLNCTTLLLSEELNNDFSEIYGYISHGIINLINEKSGSTRLRAIEITKMRGINHSTLTHSMSFQSSKGIVVLPHEIDLSS